MKKIFCIIISLCLVLGSFSFVFGLDWSSSDSTNLQYIAQRLTAGSYSAASWLQQIYGTLHSSNGDAITYLSTVASRLQYQQSIFNSVDTISSNVSSIKNALTSTGNIAYNLSHLTTTIDYIWSVLSYMENGAGISYFVANIMGFVSSIDTDLTSIKNNTANIKTNTDNIYNDQHKRTGTSLGSAEFFSPLGAMEPWSFTYSSTDDLIARYFRAQSQTLARMYAAQHQGLGSNMGSFNLYSAYNNPISTNYVSTDDILKKSFSNISENLSHLTSGYANTTHITDWRTLQTITSNENGLAAVIENYLDGIQTPIARLAYVHASDEEIRARQLAEINQTTVINNFIDPNGSGFVPSSNIGNLASISSDIKTNLNTGQAASGIFDVFTGNHSDDWYSQDTYNKLMGISNNRAAMSSGSDYPTPLLDQRMSELTSLFGGEN